jgi:hypothetical protein
MIYVHLHMVDCLRCYIPGLDCCPCTLCAVLELVLGRFPSDATILTAFTEHALEVAAAAASAGAAPSLNSTGPAAMLTQRDGDATAAAAAAQQQQQQLEVLVLEQLERAEEARTAAMKDEELSYRYDMLCCWFCGSNRCIGQHGLGCRQG